MNGGIVVQLVVDSLAAASLYAVVALAVSLAFSGSGIVHLAIGQVALGGGLTAAALYQGGVPAWLAVLAGLAVGAGLSGVAERALVAPTLGRPVLGAALLVAAAVVTQEALLGLFPHSAYAFPAAQGTLLVLGGIVHLYDLVTLGAIAAIAVAGVAVLRTPRVGASLRVTASAPAMAERIGVDTERVRTASFAVGGALATAAVLLAAPRFPLAAGGGGAILALRGIAAAAAGRMTSRERIIAAAVLIGAGEVVGQYFLGGGGEVVADAAAVLTVVVGWRR